MREVGRNGLFRFALLIYVIVISRSANQANLKDFLEKKSCNQGSINLRDSPLDSKLLITSFIFHTSGVVPGWVDRILGPRALHFQPTDINKEISNSELQDRIYRFKNQFTLPPYAVWPVCSVEALGFIRLEELTNNVTIGSPFVIGSSHLKPIIGDGRLLVSFPELTPAALSSQAIASRGATSDRHTNRRSNRQRNSSSKDTDTDRSNTVKDQISNNRVMEYRNFSELCYYRSLYDRWRPAPRADTAPNYQAVFFYCPIRSIDFCAAAEKRELFSTIAHFKSNEKSAGDGVRRPSYVRAHIQMNIDCGDSATGSDTDSKTEYNNRNSNIRDSGIQGSSAGRERREDDSKRADKRAQMAKKKEPLEYGASFHINTRIAQSKSEYHASSEEKNGAANSTRNTVVIESDNELQTEHKGENNELSVMKRPPAGFKGVDTNRPHRTPVDKAVCLVIPYTSSVKNQVHVNAAMLVEWLRYYSALGFKVLVYDRDGANREHILGDHNNGYKISQNISIEQLDRSIVYHPYTIKGLLEKKGVSGVKYDSSERDIQVLTSQRARYSKEEANRREKESTARMDSTDDDKTLTLTHCRFEARALYGTDTVLVADFDEFLYCPFADTTVAAQMDTINSLFRAERRKGYEQLLFLQLITANKTANNAACVRDIISSSSSSSAHGQSLFDCFSHTNYFIFTDMPKSVQLGNPCPLTDFHSTCDYPGLTAHDCLCKTRAFMDIKDNFLLETKGMKGHENDNNSSGNSNNNNDSSNNNSSNRNDNDNGGKRLTEGGQSSGFHVVKECVFIHLTMKMNRHSPPSMFGDNAAVTGRSASTNKDTASANSSDYLRVIDKYEAMMSKPSELSLIARELQSQLQFQIQF